MRVVSKRLLAVAGPVRTRSSSPAARLGAAGSSCSSCALASANFLRLDLAGTSTVVRRVVAGVAVVADPVVRSARDGPVWRVGHREPP